jgi:hypothetical protein
MFVVEYSSREAFGLLKIEVKAFTTLRLRTEWTRYIFGRS